ncbi:type II toxin-antitoxin system RelE/ParE family toxin [Spartinivicinus marinus]|uniref:type II toxin-antitoxin system RelE/ParE family toxin n=1 Tax=Spartinivicinus marinus TaxID=2994442 RepID=UPI001C5C8C6D|nr:type II toxin-antitoxin system RelE/ParE family toxin [Spartinivicinus marinus]
MSLLYIPLKEYSFEVIFLMWDVEFTDEFEGWWDRLTAEEQIDVEATVALLEQLGPRLPFPHSSGINNSRHNHMRELRIQHKGRPYRVMWTP